MNGPDSYAEAARLADGLAEWTSKIDAEVGLEPGELEEGLLTGLVGLIHALQANTAAILDTPAGGPNYNVDEWEKAVNDG